MLVMILCVFAACFLLERRIPGWKLPSVGTWATRVVPVNLVQLGVVLLAGVTWERWLSHASVFHLSAHVPPFFGGFIAYFIATLLFGTYENPRTFAATCGFRDCDEQKLVRMLAYRDVHADA